MDSTAWPWNLDDPRDSIADIPRDQIDILVEAMDDTISKVLDKLESFGLTSDQIDMVHEIMMDTRTFLDG